MERRRYIEIANKNYVKTSTSKTIKVNEDDIKGYASFIKIEEVHILFNY